MPDTHDRETAGGRASVVGVVVCVDLGEKPQPGLADAIESEHRCQVEPLGAIQQAQGIILPEEHLGVCRCHQEIGFERMCDDGEHAFEIFLVHAQARQTAQQMAVSGLVDPNVLVIGCAIFGRGVGFGGSLIGIR